MRITAVLRALTGVVFASASVLACGDDAAPTDAPTATSVLDQAPADAITCQLLGSSDLPSDPRISEKVVESILPPSAATSATLGFAPGHWVIAPYLGAEFVLTFAGEGSGVTAGWAAQYCSASLASEPPEDMSVELFFHDTAEHAEGTYQYFRADHANYGTVSQLADEPEQVADAVSMVAGNPPIEPAEPARTTIIIRQATVMATAQVRHGEDRDVTTGLRDFARMLALGIDEFVRSQGP